MAAGAAIVGGIECGANIAAALFAGGAQNAAARFDAIAVIVAEHSRAAFARRQDVARSADASNAFGACIAAYAAIVRVIFQVGAGIAAALFAGVAFGDARIRAAVFAFAGVANLVVSAPVPAFPAIVCVVSDIGARSGAAERLRPAFGVAFFAGIRDDIARVAAVRRECAQDGNNAPIKMMRFHGCFLFAVGESAAAAKNKSSVRLPSVQSSPVIAYFGEMME